MKGTLLVGVITAAILLPRLSSASDPVADVSAEGDDFEWFLLPLPVAASDVGFGGAVVGLFYWYEQGVQPYRDALTVATSLTSQLVQAHAVAWERVARSDLPVRFGLSVSFSASETGNYCGVGGSVDCSERAAQEAATAAGLEPSTPVWRDFVDRYYLVRGMTPATQLSLRANPFRTVPALEMSYSWRTSFRDAGFFGEEGPYDGSLLAEDVPSGDQGWAHVVEIGALYDRRDDERRPTSGWLSGVYFRRALPILGSPWDYRGLSLVGASYHPLDPRSRLILANRVVLDWLSGDTSIDALGRVGGPWSVEAFGGSGLGRGIRARRYIGKIKAVAQSELRWTILGEPGRFQLLTQSFVDLGWVGVDWAEVGARPLVGFGAGLAASWGRGFLVRIDLGFSPHEEYQPQFYLSLAQPF